MRETVTIHVGQCGNQIGNQFWNLMLLEHEDTPDFDDNLSSFFHFAPQRDGRTYEMKARALLIDMDYGPLQETMKGPLGSLFDDAQFIMDVSGSGNNFAQGHYFYGPQHRPKIEEGLRRTAEKCDSLQTFLVTHSLGGGTGSGVGTYTLSVLSDVFPKVCKFSTCVYPSEDNDVVTSPYNTILATRELIEHADCVFPVDNNSLFSFTKQERINITGKETPEKKDPLKKADRNTGFDAINEVAARMLCNLTSSSRFHGDMNVDLNEIYTNLVPYPQLHFLTTALNLRSSVNGANIKPTAGVTRKPAVKITNQRKGSYPTIKPNKPRVSRISTGSDLAARGLLQRGFKDILGPRGQITASYPTQDNCVTLASAFLARGKHVPLSDFLSSVNVAQQALRFPYWNADACKIGLCSTASPGDEVSVLGVFNSTAFGSLLNREMAGFQRLYRKKAMLHHYTEFTEEKNIQRAIEEVNDLRDDYMKIEKNELPKIHQNTFNSDIKVVKNHEILSIQQQVERQLFPAF